MSPRSRTARMRTGAAILLGALVLAVVALTDSFINPPLQSRGSESLATTVRFHH